MKPSHDEKNESPPSQICQSQIALDITFLDPAHKLDLSLILGACSITLQKWGRNGEKVNTTKSGSQMDQKVILHGAQSCWQRPHVSSYSAIERQHQADMDPAVVPPYTQSLTYIYKHTPISAPHQVPVEEPLTFQPSVHFTLLLCLLHPHTCTLLLTT